MTRHSAGSWWPSHSLRLLAWKSAVVLHGLCISGGILLAEESGRRQFEPVAQPIPFSHKQHASVGLTCIDCHSGVKVSDEAGVPGVQTCMYCHVTIKADSAAIRKLAEAKKTGEKIPWVRIYKVPDFVFFSHANHNKAGVACASCHGSVKQRDVLAQEVPTKMQTCVACHTERHASTSCVLCHQLGQ